MDKVIALIGNPNVGKSTVFNALTGMNQHTGNWAGKTVESASGEYAYKNERIRVVDLPGAYSMLAHSAEEEVTRDYICFEKPDIVVVICSATCLERNCNLLLQALEITNNVIVCVNMVDEARQKGIEIHKEKLESALKVPVIFTCARENQGISELKESIFKFSEKKIDNQIIYDNKIEEAAEKFFRIIKDTDTVINKRWLSLRFTEGDTSLLYKCNFSEELTKKISSEISNINSRLFCEKIVEKILETAKSIADDCIDYTNESFNEQDRKLDEIFTGKYSSIPIMLVLLTLCLWITIFGANYLSEWLTSLFAYIQIALEKLLVLSGVSHWMKSLLMDGVFSVLSWVISVMLPPMAIFFPLFSLLEDSGYLPRIAFNLDNQFKKCGSCGKQSLTCALGLGCNAVGVMGCRIIDSPRERLIAILTNSFMPCNGRFPTIIAIISMFLVGEIQGFWQGIVVAVILMLIIVLGICATFLCSFVLSKTLLKGEPSSFVMEMPSYRKPKIIRVIVRSFFDKTLKVLWRAIIVAAPAGAVIWLLTNTYISGNSVLSYVITCADSFAKYFGMDGVILTAFVLGLPANEIVMPIILMTYLSKNTMVPFENMAVIKQILTSNGWTIITAVCVIIFSLMHWPCSTTILTIKKETGSWKWTALSVLIPTFFGLSLCFLINIALRTILY